MNLTFKLHQFHCDHYLLGSSLVNIEVSLFSNIFLPNSPEVMQNESNFYTIWKCFKFLDESHSESFFF